LIGYRLPMTNRNPALNSDNHRPGRREAEVSQIAAEKNLLSTGESDPSISSENASFRDDALWVSFARRVHRKRECPVCCLEQPQPAQVL
jgi:hypothetical protein